MRSIAAAGGLCGRVVEVALAVGARHSVGLAIRDRHLGQFVQQQERRGCTLGFAMIRGSSRGGPGRPPSSSLDTATGMPDHGSVSVAQWAVLGLTGMAAGFASYFYNDGRDHQLKLVLQAAAVVGVVGTGLFFLAELLTPAASAVPQCDWSDLGDDLSPDCESAAEASRRAADDSLDHFMSSYVVGPALEGAAVLGGAVAGFITAMATGRKPSDGRPRRLIVDDE